MAWWRRFVQWRSDDEIATRVASMVAKGKISPAIAPMIERALRAEADGKGITMTILAKSIPKPKLPRWHSETCRENVCDFSKRNTGSFRGMLVYPSHAPE